MLLRLLLRTMRTQWCCLKRALEDSLKVVWNPSWLLCQNFKIYLCDCRSIQLLQTSKLRFGSLATPPFITARFQFIVLINCKTQQIKFELKYLPQMVFKMVGIDRKTIPIKYRAFRGKYKIWGIHVCLNITTVFWNYGLKFLWPQSSMRLSFEMSSDPRDYYGLLLSLSLWKDYCEFLWWWLTR